MGTRANAAKVAKVENVEIDYKKLKAFCEGLYYVYARRELVYPDPLWFLYKYDDIRDREIVGLIASSLAYGRVSQIMKSVDGVLSCLGSRPREFLLKHRDSDIVPSSFKHRFTTSGDMNNFLRNIRDVIMKYDTVENLLIHGLETSNNELLPALDKFVKRLTRGARQKSFPALSSPLNGSPAKRLFLFLRWLIRSDSVDPSGWSAFPPSLLLIPCDTHILHISYSLKLSPSLQPSVHTAQVITAHFAAICPQDPTKYDFVLTRFGLRSGLPAGFTYSLVN